MAVVQILTRQQLLELRMDRWNKNNARKENKESLFCDYIESQLKDILGYVGYKPKKIAREFEVEMGRFDFLVELENHKYIIIEVKHSRDDEISNRDEMYFSFAIGQLFTYKTILNYSFNIPLNDIEMMLITDVDSMLAIATIGQNKLPIKYMVVGYDGVKNYG